jgi:hypothetical protein
MNTYFSTHIVHQICRLALKFLGVLRVFAVHYYLFSKATAT